MLLFSQEALERKARRAKRFGLQKKNKDADNKSEGQSDKETDAVYVHRKVRYVQDWTLLQNLWKLQKLQSCEESRMKSPEGLNKNYKFCENYKKNCDLL